jgi:tetratricopeptide (TPR) repeat protein
VVGLLVGLLPVRCSAEVNVGAGVFQVLTDRFGNNLSTASTAARDAYIEGYDLLFAAWTGADTAFAHAIHEDPNFAIAYLGSAQVAAGRGDVSAVQAALRAAREAVGLNERELSQLAFFTSLLTGKSAEALAAGRTHLGVWPRDAAVMNQYASIVGLLGFSGRPGLKRDQELAWDYFAPQYGDDWWYLAHHAMAISEMGRLTEAHELNEKSLALHPQNGWGAHSRGHIAYESGDTGGARVYLSSFLSEYPRDGGLHGHLAWHLALSQLHAGNEAAAWEQFSTSVAPGKHFGALRTRVVDAVQFLWRWELAGHPRDEGAWTVLERMAAELIPRAGAHFTDWHMAIADAAAGDAVGLESLLAQMEALSRAGRYPEGAIMLSTANGLAAFARSDWAGAIASLLPLMNEIDRIGGSRAQLDLIEFTLLRACVQAGRYDEMRHLLAERRQGPKSVPVAGVH